MGAHEVSKMPLEAEVLENKKHPQKQLNTFKKNKK
jgi:hypothetical protein